MTVSIYKENELLKILEYVQEIVSYIDEDGNEVAKFYRGSEIVGVLNCGDFGYGKWSYETTE